MNPEFFDFLMRFGPAIYAILFIAFLAIPVALLMIWAQLGHMNEQLRVQRVLDEARLATTENPPAPRQPSPIRSTIERVVEKLDEKLVEPTVKAQPPKHTQNDRAGLKAVAKALDARAPKAPPVRETEEQVFLLIDQETKGPFLRSEVLRRLREENLSRTTLCRTADTMDWSLVATLLLPPKEDACSICGRLTDQEDLQPNGKPICAECRKFAPKNG